MSRTTSARRRSRGLGLLFATPAIALLFLFLVWPIVTGALYSTTSASGYGDKEQIGIDNYVRAFGDEALYAAFGRNVVFALVVVVASVAIGFLLAYFLFRKVRGWRALQVLLMVPYILPVVVTGLLWQFLLEPENGLINAGLRALNLDALTGPGLTAESTALGTVSVVQIWVTVPFAMLLIFGALLALDAEVLEAAEIDGAGTFATMTRIVLPMVQPTIILVTIVLTVHLFRSFDLVYLLTKGGPIGSTTIATLYVFVQGFVNNEYGYANAVGMIIGVVLVLIAVLLPILARRIGSRERALND